MYALEDSVLTGYWGAGLILSAGEQLGTCYIDREPNL